MRVLTSPSDTGAVTLSLPQDVQAEAFDFPEEFFRKRVWIIPRTRCAIKRLVTQTSAINPPGKKNRSSSPDGVFLYSEASRALANFAEAISIPVCETQAGKELPTLRPSAATRRHWRHPAHPARNIAAREADLDHRHRHPLPPISPPPPKPLSKNPAVRFININVAEFDATTNTPPCCRSTGDARATLEELQSTVAGYQS